VKAILDLKQQIYAAFRNYGFSPFLTTYFVKSQVLHLLIKSKIELCSFCLCAQIIRFCRLSIFYSLNDLKSESIYNLADNNCFNYWKTE